MINKKLVKKIINDFTSDLKNQGVSKSLSQVHVKALKSLPISLSINGLTLYLRRVKEIISANKLLVESATPLSLTDQDKICQAIKKQHQFTEVETVLNTSLLGGSRVKIGSWVIDSSVKEKINQVSEVING